MDRIEAKLIHGAVLLERQYLLLNRLISTNSCALTKFEAAIDSSSQDINNVLDVYCYVFALIDHIARYRKIALSIPKLNQKSAEFRALDSAIGNIKDIRDQLQHINNEILNENSGPLLGAVCWASGGRQFLATFNDVGLARSSLGLILNTETGKYLRDFCYVYNEDYYDLGDAIKGVEDFNNYTQLVIKIEIDGKPYNSEDHFMALRIDFKEIESMS